MNEAAFARTVLGISPYERLVCREIAFEGFAIDGRAQDRVDDRGHEPLSSDSNLFHDVQAIAVNTKEKCRKCSLCT